MPIAEIGLRVLAATRVRAAYRVPRLVQTRTSTLASPRIVVSPTTRRVPATTKEAAPAPANKAAGNGRLHKTRTRTRPHRRPLYADNGRHKNKNQAAPAPTGNGRHKTNKHEAATARARDLAPRARGTDASIPSSRRPNATKSSIKLGNLFHTKIKTKGHSGPQRLGGALLRQQRSRVHGIPRRRRRRLAGHH